VILAAEICFWLTGILMLYTFIGYPILLWGWARFSQPQPEVEEQTIPDISLIIAAYNEAAVLPSKLDNCRSLDYPAESMDVLIGSDGSTDETAAIAHRAGAQVMEFKERRGKAAVLNALVAAAEGDILVFSDANTMYRPEALRRLIRPLADPAVGGVCGCLELTAPDGSIAGHGEQLYWRYENHLKEWEGAVGTLVGATGGIYAIRRELFRPLPEDAGIPDDLLTPLHVAAAGYRVAYAPDAIGVEPMPADTNAELARKTRIGAQDFQVLPDLMVYVHPKYGFLALALLSHKIFRWLMPLAMIDLLGLSFILRHNPMYEWVWLAQVAFYGLAFVGMIGTQLGVTNSILTAPAYFVLMHAALLKGFFSAWRRKPSPYWNTIRKLKRI
jgi:poly-beta-1,6-N-acetyl-D-glucosamine synthase